MNVKQKQGIIFGLLALSAIVVIVYPPLLANLLNEKFGAAYIIKTIDNLDTEYFSITDWRISNFARSVYVFPYDKLYYHATVTSKVPYPTIAKYLLEIRSGDSNSIIADGMIPLNPESYGQISIELSTEHEGYHDVKLTLGLYNSNANFSSIVTPLEQQTRSTKLEVLSLNDKLLAEQNWYIFAGLVVSAIIGSITAYVLWKERETANEQIKELKTQNSKLENQFKESEKQTGHFKEQNELLKEQASIQNRPWISLISESPTSKHLDFFQIQFKNYGKTVAKNIVMKSWAKDGDMTKSELEQNGIVYQVIDVSPNEVFSHILPISNSLSIKANGSNDVHIGIIVKYKFERTKDGESIMLGNWNPSLQKTQFKIKTLD